MSDVDIVTRRNSGAHEYFLQHSFDLSLIDDAPGEGPYASRFEAEKAAARVMLVVTGADD
ncbi:MAG: hypothetical protein JWQ68_36 [Cryobacterium sp.]|jgi:hypothetical protein|nr:hypothetical protein [Cryobacterium sp.]